MLHVAFAAGLVHTSIVSTLSPAFTSMHVVLALAAVPCNLCPGGVPCMRDDTEVKRNPKTDGPQTATQKANMTYRER